MWIGWVGLVEQLNGIKVTENGMVMLVDRYIVAAWVQVWDAK